jgi:hypothetical protein
MKVLLIESGQLDVFQRQRVARTIRDENILAALCCMSQDVRETVENALAELHHIVAPSVDPKSLMTSCPKFGANTKVSWPPLPLNRSLPGVLASVSLPAVPRIALPELATTWPELSVF